MIVSVDCAFVLRSFAWFQVLVLLSGCLWVGCRCLLRLLVVGIDCVGLIVLWGWVDCLVSLRFVCCLGGLVVFDLGLCLVACVFMLVAVWLFRAAVFWVLVVCCMFAAMWFGTRRLHCCGCLCW